MLPEGVTITFIILKLLTVLSTSVFFAAQAYTQNSINLDTVFIGDDENEADTTGYGAVS